MNASFITSVSNPYQLAISGSSLYVPNPLLGSISEYSTTSGAVINSNLITGLSEPTGVVIAPAPEPGSLILVGIAAAVALVNRRKRYV